MENTPYPWHNPLISGKPQTVPNPSLITELLKSTGSAAKNSPENPFSASGVERSALERAIGATKQVQTLIAKGKLSKPHLITWVQHLINCMRPFYGSKTGLVATLTTWRSELSKAQKIDDFVPKVEQIEHYLLWLNASGDCSCFAARSQQSLTPRTTEVFIIHGHDQINQLHVDRMLREEFKLTPVVLLDKPGQSASTIDKFEHYAQTCSYAIALFTTDDKVRSRSGEECWQARPNVIFETGWFVGRLGKERILILLQEGVKIYSDFDGINRIQFRCDVNEKFLLIRAELEAARLVKRLG